MSTEIPEKSLTTESAAEEQSPGELVNASGHRQELERNFSLLSICAVAVTTGNTWIAQGGSVVTALSNGGLAGCIYELYAPQLLLFSVHSNPISPAALQCPSATG